MVEKCKHVSFYAILLVVVFTSLLLAPRPVHAQTETVLYNFTVSDSSVAGASGLIADNAGNLYGATTNGGLGYGTVFELSPNGSGGWNETVLYSFTGEDDGANPFSGSLIFDGKGNLYGAAAYGGVNRNGVVFELSPGASWTETVLYSFQNFPDGSVPFNDLVFDPAGNLYGTTQYGGSGNTGVVFELSPSDGGWTEQVIYQSYAAGVTADADGNIFGFSVYTVFELSPNGSGGWTPTMIHTFSGPKDGVDPDAAPVLDKARNLYGTTLYGGAKNYGTVFELSPITKGKKRGQWKEKILHSFKGKDGAYPRAAIVFDGAGNIYGTTGTGGKYQNWGTVFELVAPVGKGSYKEKVLWSFNYGADGWEPFSNLILDSAGNLYSTTDQGGAYGGGVVFEVTP